MFDKAKETLTKLIEDAKKGGIPGADYYNEAENGSFDDYFDCILNYYEYAMIVEENASDGKDIIDKLASYDKNKANANWFARGVAVLMESLGQQLCKKDEWMGIGMEMLAPLNDGPMDKNAPAVKTSTWGERAVSMFLGLFFFVLIIHFFV